MSRQLIEDCVRHSLEKYLHDLDGESVTGIYDMVMRPSRSRSSRRDAARARNQSQAATLLGINATTLRKKSAEHGLCDGRSRGRLASKRIALTR